MGCIQIHIPWNPLSDLCYSRLRLREGRLTSDLCQNGTPAYGPDSYWLEILIKSHIRRHFLWCMKMDLSMQIKCLIETQLKSGQMACCFVPPYLMPVPVPDCCHGLQALISSSTNTSLNTHTDTSTHSTTVGEQGDMKKDCNLGCVFTAILRTLYYRKWAE